MGALLALALLSALPAAGCRSSGEECDACSSDNDCQLPFVCRRFSDDSMRCASGVGATSCRTR